MLWYSNGTDNNHNNNHNQKKNLTNTDLHSDSKLISQDNHILPTVVAINTPVCHCYNQTIQLRCIAGNVNSLHSLVAINQKDANATQK